MNQPSRHQPNMNQGTPDVTGGIIPYKNIPALVAYYFAIASLIGLILPPWALLAGLGALALGIIGKVKHKAEPFRGGVVHAWIGIVLGGVMFLYGSVASILIVIALAQY
jgi:hypothetical protein